MKAGQTSLYSLQKDSSTPDAHAAGPMPVGSAVHPTARHRESDSRGPGRAHPSNEEARVSFHYAWPGPTTAYALGRERLRANPTEAIRCRPCPERAADHPGTRRSTRLVAWEGQHDREGLKAGDRAPAQTRASSFGRCPEIRNRCTAARPTVQQDRSMPTVLLDCCSGDPVELGQRRSRGHRGAVVVGSRRDRTAMEGGRR